MDAARLAGIMTAKKAQMANPLAATIRANGSRAPEAISGPDFVNRLYGDDPRDALHDLLVLFSLLQVVGRLQPHPEFRRAAEETGHLQAHDGREGSALRQNVVQHLAGHAEGFRRGRHGQAGRRQDVLLDNLAPGWTGGSPFFVFITSSLMVVFKIDILSVFA